MVATRTRFTHEVAPCGGVGDGEHYEAEDEQGLVTDNWEYVCGCVSLRQEYHDGSLYRRVVRHDGHVLVDEVGSEHSA